MRRFLIILSAISISACANLTYQPLRVQKPLQLKIKQDMVIMALQNCFKVYGFCSYDAQDEHINQLLSELVQNNLDREFSVYTKPNSVIKVKTAYDRSSSYSNFISSQVQQQQLNDYLLELESINLNINIVK